MNKVLSLLPVVVLCLTASSACNDKKQTPPPNKSQHPQYSIITGQRHDVGFGMYEYKLLIDDPTGDRWVSVTKNQYNNCWLEPKAPTYPKCAGF